jgi:predicted Zn-dependent protease
VFLETAIQRAQELFRAKEWQLSLADWRRILVADPGSRFSLLQASGAALRLHDLDGAEGHATELVRRYPEFAPGAARLGEIRVARGDLVGAASAFREGLAASPGNALLAYRLGAALLGTGRVSEAIEVIEPALEKATSKAGFLLLSALAAAQSGDDTRAAEALKQAIAAGYTDRETLETEPLLAPLRRIPAFPEIAATIPAAPAAR